jgi:hypothetical protein
VLTHQIPRTSFDLIAQDAQDTLHNLINLSTEVIFSYAKVHLSGEQQPSPLLTFNHETPAGTCHLIFQDTYATMHLCFF